MWFQKFIVKALIERANAGTLAPECALAILSESQDYFPWGKDLINRVSAFVTKNIKNFKDPVPLQTALISSDLAAYINGVGDHEITVQYLKNKPANWEVLFFQNMESISKKLTENPDKQTVARMIVVVNSIGSAAISTNLAETSQAVYDFLFNMLEQILNNHAKPLFGAKWLIDVLTKYPNHQRAWEVYHLLMEHNMKLMANPKFIADIESDNALTANTTKSKPWYNRKIMVPSKVF